MLIHGKLILTANGLMLDEVKSLLQKALRRKDIDLVTKATKELVGYGKDQLPWKSILTFLFEDHCMSNEKVLKSLYQMINRKDKKACIELLLKCHTCRVAACLPVIAMEPDYDPTHWNTQIEVNPSLVGLIAKHNGKINCDQLLAHVEKAWKTQDHNKLITYMKMVTMVVDEEKRAVTQKGQLYLMPDLRNIKKPNFGHVVLTMLYKSSIGQNIAEWLVACLKLSSFADAPMRLMLSCAVVQLKYGSDDSAKTEPDVPCDKINWSSLPKLDKMPSWAVDKHTYRGKFGRGTKHLLAKRKDVKLSEPDMEEFHGDRPLVGIEHFFNEGCQCVHPSLEDNPHWKHTQEIYYKNPPRMRKTTKMTAMYYKELVKKYKDILYVSKQVYSNPKSTNNKEDYSSGDDFEDIPKITRHAIKRKAVNTAGPHKCNGPKKAKLEDKVDVESLHKSEQQNLPQTTDRCPDGENTGGCSSSSPSNGSNLQTAAQINKPPTALAESLKDKPLLQLPTGSAKVYTRVDLENGQVWKGPYRPGGLSKVKFFHKAMADIFGDPHTFLITVEGNYVSFPLFKSTKNSVQITKKDFRDCISKKDIQQGSFVLRESLGVLQMHKVPAGKMKDVPMTLWAHFLYRFTLNVGDSGLYNAITDKNLTDIYGIDMEENRKNVNKQDLLNFMFSKLPNKAVCEQIMRSIRKHKDALSAIMEQDVHMQSLQELASEHGAEFDGALFKKRIAMARKAVKAL